MRSTSWGPTGRERGGLPRAAFRAAGLAYGAYTSPHLVDFRERIRTHLGPVPREAVVRFVAWAREEAWEEPPGFFDLSTALAFLHFRERGWRWPRWRRG